ncbi:MAG: hypothetical protein J1E62_07010 [Lachnospiraceae bacterium]|nr:hypothetical protein [Lachnospiraceae bacterium]
MIFLEIAMILIGLGAIVYSNKIIESPESGNNTANGAEEKKIKEQWAQLEKRFQVYDQKLEEKKEEQVEDTSERMSALSNEKIMGINEYSDQVIDKIEKNHAEVVFLYDMLNEKQQEIQGLIQDADTTKAEFRDEMAQSYQNTKEMAARLKEDLQEELRQLQALEETLRNNKDTIQETLDYTEENEQEESILNELAEVSPEELEELQMDHPQPFREKPAEKMQEEPKARSQRVGVNKNKEILELHDKGHSVLEISKMLVLGQGEVKFVIDMYGE